MPFILQAVTVVFAIICAWLNKWPVKVMRQYWQQGHEGESEFHGANAFVKLLFSLVVTAAFVYQKQLMAHVKMDESLNVKGLDFGAFFIASSLWQWLAFDISLNLFVGDKWYYLGQTSSFDKLVKNGKAKAFFVLLVIAGLNVLFLLKANVP